MNTEADALDLPGMDITEADDLHMMKLLRASVPVLAKLSPHEVAGIIAVCDAVDRRLVDVTLPVNQAIRYDIVGQLCANPAAWVIAHHAEHNAAFVRPPLRQLWRPDFGPTVIHFKSWPGDQLSEVFQRDGYTVPDALIARLREIYRVWCIAQRGLQ